MCPNNADALILKLDPLKDDIKQEPLPPEHFSHLNAFLGWEDNSNKTKFCKDHWDKIATRYFTKEPIFIFGQFRNQPHDGGELFAKYFATICFKQKVPFTFKLFYLHKVGKKLVQVKIISMSDPITKNKHVIKAMKKIETVIDYTNFKFNPLAYKLEIILRKSEILGIHEFVSFAVTSNIPDMTTTEFGLSTGDAKDLTGKLLFILKKYAKEAEIILKAKFEPILSRINFKLEKFKLKKQTMKFFNPNLTDNMKKIMNCIHLK